MKTVGEFKFKNLERKEPFKFTNDNNREVDVPLRYLLILDFFTEDKKVKSCEIKLSKDSDIVKFLLSKNLQPYTDIKVYFDVTLIDDKSSITPVNIEVISKDNR